MKLETTETVTLYVCMPATGFDAVAETGWQEIPPTPWGVSLRSTPYPALNGFDLVAPGYGSPRDLAQLVLRVQVRADHVEMLLGGAGQDDHELRVGPDILADLNHNLVGPVSVAAILPGSGWNGHGDTEYPRPAAVAIPAAR